MDVLRLDSVGRFVIPKRVRNQMDIEIGKSKIEIYHESDHVFIKKYVEKCSLCYSEETLVDLKGHKICVHCVEEIIRLSERSY